MTREEKIQELLKLNLAMDEQKLNKFIDFSKEIESNQETYNIL